MVENSINKSEDDDNRYNRKSMMEEIKWYCDQLGMKLPDGYPDEMSDEDMREWLMCWHEFDPITRCIRCLYIKYL